MSVMSRLVVTRNGERMKKFLKSLRPVSYYSSSSSDGRNESEKSFVKSFLGDVKIPETNLAHYLLENVGRYSKKIASVCAVTGRQYTYDEVAVKSTNFGKNLQTKLSLKKGESVALLLPNVPEFPICVIGSLLAGLRLTSINPLYTADEIRRQIRDSDSKLIITLSEYFGNASEAIRNSSDVRIVTIRTQQNESVPNGSINFDQLVNEKCVAPDLELSDVHETVFMPYSSGTTGLPKGVKLSSYNIVANVTQINHPELRITETAIGNHQDVSPQILPMFHIYGFTTTLSMIREGVKIITLPKFDRDVYLKVLLEQQPHFMLVVPPIVLFLSMCPDVKPEYFASLRSVNCGAAPLGALDEEKFRKRVGRPINILQGYGLSETSPVVTMTPIGSQGKFPGSMGTPVPNTKLKVVRPEDPVSTHLPPNQVGELLVKGPQVMIGYHNRPEETSEAFTRDGWLKTGDLVTYNENGVFYICDRLKELIKVKGFQVAPAELEEILRDFPGVSEAAVVGIPDEYSGELPRAFVVPKGNEKIDVDKLKAFVEAKVARHKYLKGGIEVVTGIPKNDSGKILRRKLKEQFLKEFSPSQQRI